MSILQEVFGEGIAVLAGDALLTEAFEIAAQSKGWPRYSHKRIVQELATVEYATAQAALESAGWVIKDAAAWLRRHK